MADVLPKQFSPKLRKLKRSKEHRAVCARLPKKTMRVKVRKEEGDLLRPSAAVVYGKKTQTNNVAVGMYCEQKSTKNVSADRNWLPTLEEVLAHESFPTSSPGNHPLDSGMVAVNTCKLNISDY